jgi:hypothetical protein
MLRRTASALRPSACLGLGLGLGHPWATQGPRKGHPSVAQAPPKGEFAKAPLFATKSENRLGGGRKTKTFTTEVIKEHRGKSGKRKTHPKSHR